MAIIDGLRNWTMPEPGLFGIFHIAFLVLIFGTTFLLIHYCKDSSEKVMKRIIFLCWLTIIVFEVGKQLLNIFHSDGIYYDFAEFPFQFCETPLYILPFLLIVRNQKLKNALISFTATYVLFAGLALTLFPITLYSDSVFFNIRTMIQHGTQVVVGLYLFAYFRKTLTRKDFINGMFVFFGLTSIAIIYNFVVGQFYEGVNMFWIAKDYPSELLILRRIKPYVSYSVFVMAYIIGFSSIAFACFVVENWVYKLCLKHKFKPAEKFELENEN